MYLFCINVILSFFINKMLISEIVLQLGRLRGSTTSKNYVFKQKSKNEKQKKVFQKWTKFELEAVVQRCSVKKLFLEILQNSQENTCARASFLIRLQVASATLLKKRPWHRCFPVNFAEFLRTPFFTEHLWWLLLLNERTTTLE